MWLIQDSEIKLYSGLFRFRCKTLSMLNRNYSPPFAFSIGIPVKQDLVFGHFHWEYQPRGMSSYSLVLYRTKGYRIHFSHRRRIESVFLKIVRQKVRLQLLIDVQKNILGLITFFFR